MSAYTFWTVGCELKVTIRVLINIGKAVIRNEEKAVGVAILNSPREVDVPVCGTCSPKLILLLI